MKNKTCNRNFFYHPRLLKYSFANGHVYNSDRLAACVERLKSHKLACCDFADATDDDLLLVHTPEYVEHLKLCSVKPGSGVKRPSMGIGAGDTPAYVGMYEACLSVAGATKAAAEVICLGDNIAFNMAGGLHHAHANHASGFCAVNDIGIGLHLLAHRFEKVAYIDIDLHHGDGPEAQFLSNPSVMTASVHQYGRGFFPGTGGASISELACINEPLAAGTGGKSWLAAVGRLCSVVNDFDPGAIVLQMGADAHYSDPLGQLNVTAREWLEAVKCVQAIGKPILGLGGGGYDHRNPARMWPAAVLLLSGLEYDDSWLDDDCSSFEDKCISERPW